MYARWREASNRFCKSEKPYRVLRLMAAEAAVSVQSADRLQWRARDDRECHP